MKTHLNKLTCLLVLAGIMIDLGLVRAETTNGIPELVQANNAFAFDLYGELKSNDGNLFFSPYSISTCLAMAYAGARGETELQMAQTLHFSTTQNQLHSAFSQLQTQLNEAKKQSGIQFDIANALWAQKEYAFLPSFLDIAKQNYDARVNQVDFLTQGDVARKEINSWVSEKTQGKIQEIIKPGTLYPETKLALINAIYFKGPWAIRFDESRTTKAFFSVSHDRKVEVQMMSKKANFNYLDEGELKLLEMPYKGKALSMVVILPKFIEETSRVESMLNQQQLSNWLSQAKLQETQVSLPKFKFTAEFQLDDQLTAMCMTNAFNNKADFSGMDGTKNLYISSVVHKAFVEVNEEGTEVAASTGGFALLGEYPSSHKVFYTDHPFLFVIRDNVTGSILFMGRVVDPTK